MIQDKVKDKFETVRALKSEEILSALGLTQGRPAWRILLPVAGVFVAGAAIGIGVAFLLAPKSGRQLRRDIREGVTALTGRLGASVGEIIQDAREAPARGADAAGSTASGENGASAVDVAARAASAGS